MTQQTNAFLREFIGYDEHQITNLDVKWEPAGPAVLVYHAPDGAMRSKPMTEEACHLFRNASIADIQELGS
jgi:hypothetical protein